MATVPWNVVVAFAVVGFTRLIWKLTMRKNISEGRQVGSLFITVSSIDDDRSIVKERSHNISLAEGAMYSPEQLATFLFEF